MDDMPNTPGKKTSECGRPKPYGLKGWLMLFWISLVFINPLYAVTSLNTDILSMEANLPGLENVPVWGNLKAYCWIHTICSVAILWAAGFYLCRRYEWRSVQISILAIWLAGPVSIILTGFGFYMMFGSLFAMMGRLLPEEFLASLIYPAIWTLYLLKSERVQNTYRKTGVERVSPSVMDNTYS